MEGGNAVVVPGTGRLELAGFGVRSGAALLDTLVTYAILLITSWIWMFFASPDVTAGYQALPRYITAIVVVLVWLYLTGTVAGGATLGMRAAGLRVLRADNASPPTPARAAARSLVLLTAVWLLSAAHPALVGVYFLLMLAIPKRRLPHDLVAGTVVVRAPARAAAPARRARPEASADRPIQPNLDPTQARTLLRDLDNLRRRSEGDLHRASVPLIVLGLLALTGAAIDRLQFSDLFLLPWLFWVGAGPVGLAATAWWYRRLRLRDGAGTSERDIAVIAVLVGCAAVAGAFVSLGGAITAAGFLAVALARRSRVLAAAALVSGLVIGLEQPFHALSNGLTHAYPGLPAAVDEYGTTVIIAVLGMSLLAVGGLALHRERAR